MLRKIVTMIEEWERGRTTHGHGMETRYQRSVLQVLLETPSPEVHPYHEVIEKLLDLLSPDHRGMNEGPEAGLENDEELYFETLIREFHNLRYGLMNSLGAAPADWDFYDPGSGSMKRSQDKLLPLSLYLDDIRSPYNVGSIFRTAEAFGIEQMFLSKYTASPEHKRALRTSMGCTEVLPWKTSRLDKVAEELPVFALELGGVELDQFHFPHRGVAVIGSEELGISPESRRIALGSMGIVSIPLRGAKGSLNAAVAAGILLNSWVSQVLNSYSPEAGM